MLTNILILILFCSSTISLKCYRHTDMRSNAKNATEVYFNHTFYCKILLIIIDHMRFRPASVHLRSRSWRAALSGLYDQWSMWYGNRDINFLFHLLTCSDPRIPRKGRCRNIWHTEKYRLLRFGLRSVFMLRQRLVQHFTSAEILWPSTAASFLNRIELLVTLPLTVLALCQCFYWNYWCDKHLIVVFWLNNVYNYFILFIVA